MSQTCTPAPVIMEDGAIFEVFNGVVRYWRWFAQSCPAFAN